MKLAFVFLLFLATTQADASWFERLKTTRYGKHFNKDKLDVDKVSSLMKSVRHAVKKMVLIGMSFWKPGFCHDLECPPYKLVFKKGNDYEKRCYPSAMWVATEGKATGPHAGDMYSNLTRSMFGKLFSYIDGENDKKMKIKMTTPVLTEVKTEEKLFGMHFYVPSKLQSDVPKPTNPDVFTTKIETCVYVQSFPGYIVSYSTFVEKVQNLKSYLKKDGLEDTYDPSMFAFAEYDDPWKFFNRHNEVWLKIKK